MIPDSPDRPDSFTAAPPAVAWTRHTCSWCGEIGPAGPCGGCGHRNDVPRLACDCGVCRHPKGTLLGMSPVERAAFDLVAQQADRSLATLRNYERKQVLMHLSRAFDRMTA